MSKSGDLAIFAFNGPDGNWLDFVVANRKEMVADRQYDLIIGPVANDSTLTVIDDYMDGRYTRNQAI